jgi:hypothetical protein
MAYGASTVTATAASSNPKPHLITRRTTTSFAIGKSPFGQDTLADCPPEARGVARSGVRLAPAADHDHPHEKADE